MSVIRLRTALGWVGRLAALALIVFLAPAPIVLLALLWKGWGGMGLVVIYVQAVEGGLTCGLPVALAGVTYLESSGFKGLRGRIVLIVTPSVISSVAATLLLTSERDPHPYYYPFALISLVAMIVYFVVPRLTGYRSLLVLGLVAGTASAMALIFLSLQPGERLILNRNSALILLLSGLGGAACGLLGAALYSVMASLTRRLSGRTESAI